MYWSDTSTRQALHLTASAGMSCGYVTDEHVKCLSVSSLKPMVTRCPDKVPQAGELTTKCANMLFIAKLDLLKEGK